MPDLTHAQIEDAMLAAFRADADMKLVQNGGYSKLIETYAGQFVQAIEELILIYPCIFVAFMQARYRPGANQQTEPDPMTFAVLYGDQNLRGNAAARRGAAGSIGTYRMLKDGRDLLQGKQLGLDINPLQITREAVVANTRDVSVYVQEYQTGFIVNEV